MKKFAKLFDTKYGQFLAIRQTNDNNEPCIEFTMSAPENSMVDIISSELTYKTDEDADREFSKLDQKGAEFGAKQLSKIFKDF